ncbi:MAG: PAS domain-containing protein, partial [Proteobacteria bacterium]|nr:PAS domain-containing protein [Pseudomonadota bacterium]
MSNLKQHKDKILTDVFGNTEAFILEHQCFNGMCFFTAVIFIVSVAMNYLIGLNLEITLGTLFFGFLFSFFYYLSRFKGYFYPIYWSVLFFGCLFVSLAWFYTGGISGTATSISLIILAIINLITAKGRRIVSIFILSLYLGMLYLVEYIRPDLVVPYDNNAARFIDNYFTFIIAVLIISFVIHFTMQHFRSERKKVTDREGKLKAILDNIPDLVWLKDDTQKITIANKPFSDVCGKPILNIINKTVFDIWPQKKAEQFQTDDLEILATGKTLHREETLVDIHDEEKRFEIIKKPIMDQQGKITGIVGIARDITARYEYEDRLKKYERIVGTSMDQMALVNTDYQYEAANNSYVAAHACQEVDLVGRTVAKVHGVEAFEKKIKPRMDKAFLGEVVIYQDEVLYDGIKKRHVEVSYFPHKNGKGITISVVVHIKDITDNKQMKQRLIQSEKMEAIGTLAGGIAHDFNNILSGILGYAQLGKINIDQPGKVNRHLDQIIKGSQRAGELVKQILTFSRQYEYEKQPLEVAIVVKEALKLIRASIPAFIEIKENIDSKAVVLADPSQIHQIIMNLCTNAYHSMLETKGTLTVILTDLKITDPQTISTTLPPGDYLKLEVCDTGHGMDEQTLEKVFDPYFTTKDVGKGTGLGLALVQGIVEEHNGCILVDTKIGQGTSFKLFFPVMEKETRLSDLPAADNLPLSKGTERIMIVDDEKNLLEALQRKLRKDFALETALGPDEGLAALKNRGPFSVVISDLR